MNNLFLLNHNAQRVILNKFKVNYTPVSFFAGYLGGQIDAYKAMQERMRLHDEGVDYYRQNQ